MATRPVDRENVRPGIFAGKENLLSDRRHTGRKQAFGELKNVIHNTGVTTPMKATNRELFNTPATLKCSSIRDGKKKASTNVQSNILNPEKHTELKFYIDFDNDYPQYNYEVEWSKQSALTDDEIFRIYNGSDDDELLPKLPKSDPLTFDELFADVQLPTPDDHFYLYTDEKLPELPPFEFSDLMADF